MMQEERVKEKMRIRREFEKIIKEGNFSKETKRQMLELLEEIV